MRSTQSRKIDPQCVHKRNVTMVMQWHIVTEDLNDDYECSNILVTCILQNTVPVYPDIRS